jgi:hypothetical protein
MQEFCIVMVCCFIENSNSVEPFTLLEFSLEVRGKPQDLYRIIISLKLLVLLGHIFYYLYFWRED